VWPICGPGHTLWLHINHTTAPYIYQPHSQPVPHCILIFTTSKLKSTSNMKCLLTVLSLRDRSGRGQVKPAAPLQLVVAALLMSSPVGTAARASYGTPHMSIGHPGGTGTSPLNPTVTRGGRVDAKRWSMHGGIGYSVFWFRFIHKCSQETSKRKLHFAMRSRGVVLGRKCQEHGRIQELHFAVRISAVKAWHSSVHGR